jgi:alpha-tubulin suppressor-like RCC1 family protein
MLTVVAGAAALCALVIAPPAVAATPTGRTVAAGNNFTLVLKADGTVVGFGQNYFGQLGTTTNNSTYNPNPTPTQIPGLTNVISIAAGHTWGVALRSDGTVWTFGYNFYGQLGRTPNSSPNPTPTQVTGLDKVTAIAAGEDHTLALRADGTVWGFGTNGIGELGNAIPVGTVSATPVQIPGLSHITAIAAGSAHSLVLRSDGRVLAFGYNFFGQLGNTTNNNMFVAGGNPTPTEIDGLSGVSAISAGTNFSIVLRTDGTVWGFGTNSQGELGSTTNNGVSTANPTPTQVSGLSGIIAISADGHHTLALQSGARVVFGFGPNFWGQLGRATNNNTNNANPTPVQVAGLSNVTALAAGSDHSVVVRGDGGAASFGRNAYGELGAAANAIANPVATNLLTLSGAGQPPAFASLVPARLLDSRPGSITIDGDYAGDDVRTADLITVLRVVGRGGVPNDATAVVLNVTVTQAEGTGFITAYPCGSDRPNASNLNYTAGATIANAVIAKVGTNGNVCLYTSAAVQLIADVNAYYRDTSAFASLVPARLLDSRPGLSTVDHQSEGIGVLGANSITELKVTDRGGVPANATAVALNVTVNQAQASGYVTAYPCGTEQPNASNLNYEAGSTIPNAVIVRIGLGGKVCLYTSAATHLIADVNAYLRDTTTSASVVPARFLDTRPGSATIDHFAEGIGLRAFASVTELRVAGRDGVPADATAVVLNVTVTGPIGNAFVTVFPCGSEQPNASNINYLAGQTIANLVIAKVGDGGNVCIFTLAPGHLIADVNAYYT